MNAVIYARFSSYNQTERSIEGQIEDCMAYAERNGYNVIKSYIDRAKSGTEADKRTDFQRMINDSASGQFDTVLVWKLDRFARNRYDSANYKHKLKKNGVRLLSVNEPVSDDPTGIMLESILEGAAEYYSANLSQNVKRGIRVSLEHGNYIGGITPYGYQIDNKKVIINETEAEAVRYIFEQYNAGTSCAKIAAALNAKGLKPRLSDKFKDTSFSVILKNRKYLGEYSANGVDYPDIYPQIVDADLFNAVQRKINANKRAPGAWKAKVDYLLQGKAFCGHCGAPLVGESGKSKTGAIHNYYACAVKKKYHKCKKKNERKQPLEFYIVERTVNYILTPDRIDFVADALVKKYESDFNVSGAANLEKTINRLDREISDAVDNLLAFTGNKPVQDKIAAKIEILSAQKEDAESDLATLRIAMKHALKKEDCVKWLSSFRGGDPLDEKYQKRIIDTFINAVYVFDDKLVTYYNVKDEEQITYDEMLDDLTEEEKSSDLIDSAPPLLAKIEHLIIKSSKIFGAIFKKADG